MCNVVVYFVMHAVAYCEKIIGLWYRHGLCRVGSLKTVASKISKRKLDHYKRSDGMCVVVSQQTIIYFIMEMGMLTRDRLFRA
jgi:hypothetical protein